MPVDEHIHFNKGQQYRQRSQGTYPSWGGRYVGAVKVPWFVAIIAVAIIRRMQQWHGAQHPVAMIPAGQASKHHGLLL